MRHFHVVTVHPSIVTAYGQFGVFKSAFDKGLGSVSAIDLRDYAVDRHGSIDAAPYGGGDGMVMRVEPLAAAIDALPVKPLVFLTSPAGRPWTQGEANRHAAHDRPIAIVCGRFAGVDQRFIDLYVDEQYSMGDVVLAGGELPALAMIESILRLVPGVLGHSESASKDSFMEEFDFGLEHPLYTRPAEFRGLGVPQILRSGDHKAIAQWRREEAEKRTRALRPDLVVGETRSYSKSSR